MASFLRTKKEKAKLNEYACRMSSEKKEDQVIFPSFHFFSFHFFLLAIRLWSRDALDSHDASHSVIQVACAMLEAIVCDLEVGTVAVDVGELSVSGELGRDELVLRHVRERLVLKDIVHHRVLVRVMHLIANHNKLRNGSFLGGHALVGFVQRYMR